MFRTLWLLPATIALASCATSGQSPSGAAPSGFCQIASPTYLDKHDVLTDATLRKILSDNETGAKLCGWKPPNAPKT